MADVKSTRREKARATRRRIVGAAYEEFVGSGFHGATMAGIARRAGVAPQTVYFVFHTKAELISAVIDAAVMGEEDPRPPQAQPWWATMVAEPDAAEALRIFIRGAAEVYARAAPISEVLRAAALTDEEVRRTHEHHEELRRQGAREVVDMLAGKARLKADLTLDEHVDVFMTILGDSTYNLLTTERRWAHARVVDWLCATLPGLLLADPA